MNITIVYAHPAEGSFNYAVLESAMNALAKHGNAVTVIDLYKDGFDPVMSSEDLSLYSKGESTDTLVKKYNKILNTTDKIVFVFPIWWYDMPAILRGFFDKVMLPNVTFGEGEDGIYPLRKIYQTRIYTTSAATSEQLVDTFGDPIRGTIIAGTFKMIGFENAVWHNLGGISTASLEQREAFLRLVGETV